MIGYVTIGARDSEASGKFYDAVFGAIGNERKFADGGWIGYGPKGKDEHSVYVCPPFNKEAASSGNGMMIAFKTDAKDKVDAAPAPTASAADSLKKCRRVCRFAGRAIVFLPRHAESVTPTTVGDSTGRDQRRRYVAETMLRRAGPVKAGKHPDFGPAASR